MQVFDSKRSGIFDCPIATVKPQSVSRRELTRQLEALEGLDLSAQDRGFLQLAKAVMVMGEGEQSRPCAEWGKGLVS